MPALDNVGSMILNVDNVANSLISVASAAKLDLYGTINLDMDDVTILSEDWILVSSVGTTTYESSFALMTVGGESFTQTNDVWTYASGSQRWTFTEATGVLSLMTVPEPGTLVLLAIFCAASVYYGSRKFRERKRGQSNY